MHDEEQRISNPNKDIPDYKAPFSLGKGIGFDERPIENNTPKAEEVQQLITDVLTGNTQQNSEGDNRVNLGGPFPVTDEIDGVMTNTIGNFIGSNAMNYISKFKKMQNGKKISFNFAAFFFAPYWFFYRKLYKVGCFFMTLILAGSIVVTPYLYDVMEVYEKFASLMSSGTLTEAQFTEFYNEMLAVSGPMMIYAFASLLIQFVIGFIANPIYKKHVIEHAGIAERSGSKNAAMTYIVKNGGASILIAGASYFGYQLVTMLISYLL
jgi:hypothetical protein